VRAADEIGRKNKIFFALLLVFSFPSFTSLRLCVSVVKNDTFARANVVIARSTEAVRARLTADLPAVAGNAEDAPLDPGAPGLGAGRDICQVKIETKTEAQFPNSRYRTLRNRKAGREKHLQN